MHYKTVRNSQAMNGVPGMNGFSARSQTSHEWVFSEAYKMTPSVRRCSGFCRRLRLKFQS